MLFENPTTTCGPDDGEILWLCDINLSCSTDSWDWYHAFRYPEKSSLCGGLTTKDHETKTPGGGHCKECDRLAPKEEGEQR